MIGLIGGFRLVCETTGPLFCSGLFHLLVLILTSLSPLCCPLLTLSRLRGPTSRGSVDLDGGVDLPDEPETREEADGAGEHEEGHGGHGHVREVQHRRHKAFDLKLGIEVPNRVEEEVAAGGARREEGSPPPAVVLVAELEVAHDDGDLCAGHDEDDQHHEQEPEHEVDLTRRESVREREERGGEGGSPGGATWRSS
jgi:hypothetical protein